MPTAGNSECVYTTMQAKKINNCIYLLKPYVKFLDRKNVIDIIIVFEKSGRHAKSQPNCIDKKLRPLELKTFHCVFTEFFKRNHNYGKELISLTMGF